MKSLKHITAQFEVGGRAKSLDVFRSDSNILNMLVNALQVLPGLIGSRCAEEWRTAVMMPVCSEDDVEQSGSHSALKAHTFKKTTLFDSLLNALPQL